MAKGLGVRREVEIRLDRKTISEKETKTFFLEVVFSFIYKDFIYLFLERGKETSPVWGCLSHTPNWGPGPKPRHVL